MNPKLKIICLFVCMNISVNGQYTQKERDSISQRTQIDFNEMKQQLGITVVNRPGPSGDPRAINAANTDEGKVIPYTLPDPLILNNGQSVNTAETWWKKRRPEIVKHFEDEMYGRVPENIPSVYWTVVSEKDTMAGPYPVTEKLMVGKVDNTDFPEIEVEIQLLIGLPKNMEQPVPLVTRFGFIKSPWGSPLEPKSYFISAYEPLWKQQLISQQWGYAILVPNSIQADHGAGLTKGVIGLANKGEQRKPTDWGTLRAWAWGASKAMDYYESDPEVDAARIGIEGTSRYGKAALVAMAFDPRFSLGFIGSSGAGGASLLRRNFGEMVENLASSGEYHWFCGNFIKFASILKVTDLPVDAHELVALCAPRPVFISVGSPLIEGNWVDAKGMFLAGVHASPVYELLGKKGMENNVFPVMGKAMTSGEVAFRQHAGGHSTGPNWSTWIAWAHSYWEIKK